MPVPPSEKQLRRLHAAHAAGVHRFVWAMTGDEALAGDTVQEVFVKLARDIAPLSRARSEKAYLYRMARNAALDALRRRESRDAATAAWAAEVPQWFEPTAASDGAILSAEQVAAALAALPDEQRTVVQLHVWDELSFREIGLIHGIPTQTAASRYRYGLEKLRTLLEPLRTEQP